METHRPFWVTTVVTIAVAALIAVVAYAILARDPGPRIASFEECVAAGFPVQESFPARCTADGQVFTQHVTTTTSTPDRPAGLSSESGNIRVFVPAYGATVGVPLVIAGEARVFENTVSWRLRDADGVELARGFTTAASPDIGQFGTFAVRSSYPQPRGAQGTVEVFAESAKDGSEIDKVVLPITFNTAPTATARVFFSSTSRDPQSLRCATTYPVTRRVARTDAPARAALEELLAGPTATESQQGYTTNIPQGVRILGLSISPEGVARVDLSEELRAVASGACRVSAIRSQIEQTLLQFASVQRVEITIAGEANALEP